MVKHPKFYRKSSVLYRFRFFDTLIQIFSGFCYVKHYTIFFVLCTEFFCVFIGCAGNIRQKHFDRSHQIMSHFSILSEFSLIFRNGHSERHAKKRNREFCFTQNQRLLLFFIYRASRLIYREVFPLRSQRNARTTQGQVLRRVNGYSPYSDLLK